MIRDVCKGLGQAQDQPLHAWHCGRGMEKNRPAVLEPVTSYLGSRKMGEMERKLQRAAEKAAGLGAGCAGTLRGSGARLLVVPSVMLRASTLPCALSSQCSQAALLKRLFEMPEP